jgi:hypothetical protein
MKPRSGNAFTSSASIFEVLSDVDVKFSKLVDKECDAINGEVKKWFKKLMVSRKWVTLGLCVADISVPKERREGPR